MSDIYTNLQKLIDNTQILLGKYDTAVNDFINLVNEKVTEFNTTISKISNDAIAKMSSTAEAIYSNVGSLAISYNFMSEAEYRAVEDKRAEEYPGAGFIEFGTGFIGGDDTDMQVTDDRCIINKGMWVHNAREDVVGMSLHIGRRYSDDDLANNSKFFIPEVVLHGRKIKLTQSPTAIAGSIKDYDAYAIPLPPPPKFKGVITDTKSTNLDLEYGDFFIVRDYTRNLLDTISLEHDDGCTLEEYDDGIKYTRTTADNAFWKFSLDGKRPLAFGKYKLKFKITDLSRSDMILRIYHPNFAIPSGKTTYYVNLEDYQAGDYVEIEFALKKNVYKTTDILQLDLGSEYVNEWIKIDDISIFQIEETIGVTYENIPAGSDLYDYVNLSVFGTQSVTKTALVLLETWEEYVDERDVVFPYGCVQYYIGNQAGMPYLSNVSDWMEDWETYCAYGNFEGAMPFVPKAHQWSKLTDEQKKIFASYPENNIFVTSDGRYKQVRYRVRVIDGLSNDWRIASPEYTTTYSMMVKGGIRVNVQGPLSQAADFYDKSNGLPISRNIYIDAISTYNEYPYKSPGWYGSNVWNSEYREMAIPICLVQQRNNGIFHKFLNPHGTAYPWDADNNRALDPIEYAYDDSFIKSLEDCFDINKIAAVDEEGNFVAATDENAKYLTGTVYSHKTASETNWYADMPVPYDIKDLRMDARRLPLEEILYNEVEKLYKPLDRGRKNAWRLIFELNVNTLTSNNGLGYYIKTDRITKDNIVKDPYSIFTDYTVGYFLDVLLNTKVKTKTVLSHPEVGVYEIDGFYAGYYYIGGNINNDRNYEVLKKFENKQNVNVRVYSTLRGELEDDYDYHQFYVHTDLIGDIRKLKDRIKYTVTSTDEVIDLTQHDYVLCQDATNNNGTVGHAYRYVGSDITEVHTNSTDGTANASGGHIDFSDTTKWLDLGDDLEIGGLPEFMDENLKEYVHVTKSNPKYTPAFPIYNEHKSVTTDKYCYFQLPVSKPLRSSISSVYGIPFRTIAFNTKTGEIKNIPSSVSFSTLSSGQEACYYYESGKRLMINICGEENYDVDFWVVLTTYLAKTDEYKYANNGPRVLIDDKVHVVGSRNVGFGTDLLQTLTGNMSLRAEDSKFTRMLKQTGVMNKQIHNYSGIFDGRFNYNPTHDPIELPGDDSPAVKFLPSLRPMSPSKPNNLVNGFYNRLNLILNYNEIKPTNLLDPENNKDVFGYVQDNAYIDDGAVYGVDIPSILVKTIADAYTDILVWISDVNVPADVRFYLKGKNDDGSSAVLIGNLSEYTVFIDPTNPKQYIARIPLSNDLWDSYDGSFQFEVHADGYEQIVVGTVAVVDRRMPDPVRWSYTSWSDDGRLFVPLKADYFSYAKAANGENINVGQIVIPLPYYYPASDNKI